MSVAQKIGPVTGEHYVSVRKMSKNWPSDIGALCQIIHKCFGGETISQTSREILYTFGRRSSSETYMVYGILVYSIS